MYTCFIRNFAPRNSCWREDFGTFPRTNRFDIDDDRANIVLEKEGEHFHDADGELITVDRFNQSL